MAPNPVILARQQPSPPSQPQPQRRLLSLPVFTTIPIILLAATQSWTRTWIVSGVGIESLLLIHGTLNGARILPGIHLGALLAILNFSYLLSLSTWLLRVPFILSCYAIILATCLFQLSTVSSLARRLLSKSIRGSQFWSDRVGLFDIPALAIDSEVSGLFLVRGITVSLLDLTIEAHGLELGLRINSEIELALCLDLLTIRLFRYIHVSDVYGNLKVGEDKGIFINLANVDASDRTGIQASTKVLNERHRDRLNEHESIEADSAAHFPSASAKAPNNGASTGKGWTAEDNYVEALKHIQTTSQIYEARENLKNADPAEQPRSEKEMRQMICAKLQEVPTVSHIPTTAVSVYFLQTVFPRIRRFLHRLPWMLRLLLNMLSSFHPINLSSISLAGPGEQLERLIQEHVFSQHTDENSNMTQFDEEVSSWLASADFCLEMADLAVLAYVPLSSTNDITIYLRSPGVGLFRTALQSSDVTLVTHVAGADATIVIPAFLLPHHEHCLPPIQREGDSLEQSQTRSDVYVGDPVAGNNDRSEESAADEAVIMLSAHASLPTFFDQSLLDIGASLAKATQLIDLENLFEQDSSTTQGTEGQLDDSVNTSSGNHMNSDDAYSDTNSLAKRARQSIKDSVKKVAKRNALGDKLNDRWIAKTISRLAAQLEQANGDFGYTTRYSIPLQPYRSAAETPSKILP